MSRLLGEPERDPRLGNLLRRLEMTSEPGDADELRRRIMAAARPRLAGLQSSSPRWWELIAAWTRVAVPVGENKLATELLFSNLKVALAILEQNLTHRSLGQRAA